MGGKVELRWEQTESTRHQVIVVEIENLIQWLLAEFRRVTRAQCASCEMD